MILALTGCAVTVFFPKTFVVMVHLPFYRRMVHR